MTPDTIAALLSSFSLDLHTAAVGIVESYDASKQTANIRLAVRRVVPAESEEDETDTPEDLPVLPSVPVLRLAGRGFYLHFPLEAGDAVLVVFAEHDIGAWRGGTEGDPTVRTRHGLSGAIAIPGLFQRASALSDAVDDEIAIGSDGGLRILIDASRMAVGGDSDAAALASKVAALQSKYNTLRAEFVSHTHTVSGAATGAPLVGGPPPGPPTAQPSNEDFASQVLKVGS